MTDPLNQGTAGSVEQNVDTPPVSATSSPAATQPETKTTRLSLSDSIAAAHVAVDKKQAEQNPEAGKPAEQPKPTDTALQPEDRDPISGKILDPIKAPGGMPPALREEWASVPRKFKEYWSNRERDMAVRLQEVAETRKFADGIKKVAEPYNELLTKGGTDFTSHVTELMQMSHALHTGSPQQKAQLFYNLLRQFQPDPATLQSLIAGQAVNIDPLQPAKAPEPKPEAAPQTEDPVASFIQKFASESEFYNDVLPLMQRVVDDETLIQGSTHEERIKAAYEFACQHHPDVKTVIAARAAKASTSTQTAPTSGATAASNVQTQKPITSAKPSLGTGGRSDAPKPKLSITESIARARQVHGG